MSSSPVHIICCIISLSLLVAILFLVIDTRSMVKKMKLLPVTNLRKNLRDVPIGCMSSCGACGADTGNYDSYVTPDQCQDSNAVLSPNCQQCCNDIQTTCKDSPNPDECFGSCTGHGL